MIEHDEASDGSARWHARHHRTVVGTATLRQGPDSGARYLQLSVDRGHRRRGIGSRLLDAVVANATATGLSALVTVVDNGSPGAAFARVRGGEVADELVRMTLDLAQPASTTYGPPDGYRLVHWWDVTPEDWLASYAITRRYLADAPNAYPPPVHGRTPAEVRAREATSSGSVLTMAAVYDGPDEAGRQPRVVAATELAVDDGPVADQLDTAVRTEHRRRGLATAVKSAALAQLRAQRPDTRTLTATTAVANLGMRAVNRRLGFVEIGYRTLFRLPLG